MATDDDTPVTARSSGSLALFLQTAIEAIEKLDTLPTSEDTIDLRREAIALQAIFRSWDLRAPPPEERASAVGRVMDLHRAVEECAAKKT